MNKKNRRRKAELQIQQALKPNTDRARLFYSMKADIKPFTSFMAPAPHRTNETR